MTAMILKRLLAAVPVIFGITFVSFIIVQLAPGDYFNSLLMNPEIDQTTIDRMREQLGFHKPFIVQYLLWLKGVLTLDLGVSTAYKIPVFRLVLSRLMPTLWLSVSSIIIIWLVSIPLGLICAIRKYSLWDHSISLVMFMAMSVPSFFTAFLLVYLSYYVPGLPSGGLTGANYDFLSPLGRALDIARHMVIPVTVVVISAVGGLVRLVKTNVLEVYGSLFITAARARGLSENAVILKHLLKNSLNPLITILGFQLSGLLSGVALTEAILSWPGLGSLVLDAVLQQDTQVVMASLLISSLMLIAGNLAADVLLRIVDPRTAGH